MNENDPQPPAPSRPESTRDPIVALRALGSCPDCGANFEGEPYPWRLDQTRQPCDTCTLARRALAPAALAPASPPTHGTFPGDLDRMPSGHPRHCEARQRWGDGECECGAPLPQETAARFPPPMHGHPLDQYHRDVVVPICDAALDRAEAASPALSEERLAELERLLTGAWPAPWVAHTFEIECPCPNGEDCGDLHTCEQIEAPEAYPASPEEPAPAGEGQCVVQIAVPGLESLAGPNAAFIAAARNALPALVSEVRRLRSAPREAETPPMRKVATESLDRAIQAGIEKWLEPFPPYARERMSLGGLGTFILERVRYCVGLWSAPTPGAPTPRSCLWHRDCDAADRALNPGVAGSHPPPMPTRGAPTTPEEKP